MPGTSTRSASQAAGEPCDTPASIIKAYCDGNVAALKARATHLHLKLTRPGTPSKSELLGALLGAILDAAPQAGDDAAAAVAAAAGAAGGVAVADAVKDMRQQLEKQGEVLAAVAEQMQQVAQAVKDQPPVAAATYSEALGARIRSDVTAAIATAKVAPTSAPAIIVSAVTADAFTDADVKRSVLAHGHIAASDIVGVVALGAAKVINGKQHRMYKVQLHSAAAAETVLRRKQSFRNEDTARIYVQPDLTPAERQQKREWLPTHRAMRLEGKRVDFHGAHLMERVEVEGKPCWVPVTVRTLPGPPHSA